MLLLTFSGWFQCRLATNPDPTDERRGVSGYTFALGEEPDLDRVIRLQNPVAPRSHGPRVGVSVTEVKVDGKLRQGHPLVGASVELLGEARFESRNRVLSDDKAGTGPIHPFHLRISTRDASLERADVLDPDAPEAAVHEASAEALNRRAPTHLDGFRVDAARIRAAAGIEDAVAYRRRRLEKLEADLREATDPLAASVLRKRIRELAVEDPLDHRVLMLQVVQTRRFDLRGQATVRDLSGMLGSVDTVAPWPLEFWLGGWDADALCGFMQGTLQIPRSRR